ncbi:MAG: AAA family ATPase [Planctomycetes bacterium]|nr:AAA family ATPase [Planctomycetota bacterium]
MTPERLKQLIGGGETLAVEFKGEEKGTASDRDLVETVVCLANRVGGESGYLLVGVEDDGRVTGARPRHEAGHTDPVRVQALVANRTRPSLTCRVQVVSLEGKEILVIEVPASRVPVGTTDGTYVRRAIGGRGKPECLPFHFHEMQAMLADRGMLDYSALVVPDARWEDLDPLEFERFRRAVRESEGHGDRALLDLPNPELAKALGAVEGAPTSLAVRVLALLLFGREEAVRRFIPTHEVAFQVLAHTRVEVNDFFRWPLLRAMDEALSRFRAKYHEEEILVGMQRIGVPDCPMRAFREGVANALIHRDYSRLGAVHIQWHEDRIEILNPGGFPEGVRLDNLLVTAPKPRNPLLADAFKRAGIVERTGRGIDTIFAEQLRAGHPAPSYDRSTETDVALVLPGGKANLDWVRLLVEESQAGRPLGLDALLVLHRLAAQPLITATEAAAVIQKPEPDARTVLEQLVAYGLMTPCRDRKTPAFQFSAASCQRLGMTVAQGTERSIESEQLAQKVLQYVLSQGRITRREAADLCDITSSQAKRLLARLVAQRRLIPRGQGKGTYYERVP